MPLTRNCPLLACALAAWLSPWPLTTIASRFGALPSALPQFDFPRIPFERTREMLPSSFTIAFLAGVESLLSAVVAEGMTGRRHRSNAELLAQGVANCASALFGGLPATGAIARTATNVRAGARSPVAGMLHALFVLSFMLLLAPWMGYVPLAALAAILVVVAWNISEFESFRHTLSAPKGDRLVLLLTLLVAVRIIAGLVAAWHGNASSLSLLDAGALLAIGAVFLGYGLAYTWGLRARLPMP